MYIKTLSVTELNNYIKRIVDGDIILNNSSIKGEISNLKFHSSGHLYFSLKDENSKLNCVMFKSDAENLKFIPENGMKVVVKGRISVYLKDGSYQLYCAQIEPEGIGELYIAFEKLKEKLRNEGIFEETHKKPIPKFSKKIGVITSPTGAAIKDIINVTKRRNQHVELVIYPALVQGIKASEDIIKGIKTLNSTKDIDVIIIARGGGSIEELWSFNDEDLAYAIYNSKKPIITGVGHETDFTIVDFVSDRRAPTPSAAAEIAVFDEIEFTNKINYLNDKLNYLLQWNIKSKFNELNLLVKNLEKNNPKSVIINNYKTIDNLNDLLKFSFTNRINEFKSKFEKLHSNLELSNPLNILSKGYSVIESKEGHLISTQSALEKEKDIVVTLSDGKVNLHIDIEN